MSEFIRNFSAVTTGRVQIGPKTAGNPARIQSGQIPFGELLKQQLGEGTELTLSKHAQSRVDQRQIPLTDSDMARLGEAVESAQQKGLKDTLVLMNNTAFIINIPSKVVVTVVGENDGGTNVFTNIDGAVIL